MALVLGQTVAGAVAALWISPLWGEVKRGFFTLCGSILTPFALAAWWSTKVSLVAGSDAGTWAERLTAASLAATVIWTLCMLVRQRSVARVVGLASVPVAAAALIAMSGAGRQSAALALFQLAAGAAFLGSVLDGLLLGHWYLTDRGLTRGPIERATRLMLGAIVVEAAAIVSGGFKGVATSRAINPLLTVGALAPWIALGMVAATGLIAVMVKAVLKGERASAVQSATGFFYLAVVTAFTAEVAVKTRFLPG